MNLKKFNETEALLFRLAKALNVEEGHGWKKDLASRLDISANNLSNFISRNTIPRRHILAAIKKFNLSPGLIFDEVDEAFISAKAVARWPCLKKLEDYLNLEHMIHNNQSLQQ